jgi:hypothetical protein
MRFRLIPLYIALSASFALLGCAHTPPAVSSAGGGSVSGPDPSFSALQTAAASDFPLISPVYKLYDLSLLRVGMSKTEVLSLFAKPKITKRTPKDEYWEYAWFELYFRDGRLVNWFDL